MRIGVDASCWANERGYGRFTRELCAAMVALAPEDEFVFFADATAAKRFELRGANVRLVQVAQSRAPTEAASADGNRSPIDLLRMTRAVAREPLEAFFSPSVYTFFPLPPRLRAVVTLHDAIAERYPHLTFQGPRQRWLWSLKVRLALAQARLVLTVSEHARSELQQVLRLDPARIRVAVEAPSAIYRPSAPAEIAAAASRAGLPAGARWFTYVGGFNPHKHVDLLVRAHGALARELDPAPFLLLVGTLDRDVFHGDQAKIRAEIERCGQGERVRWTGFVPDEELRHLHSGAIALALPSECEGFGLPAVEAAACGAAVIATRNSPLPGLLEGGGLFVAPRDEAGLLAALRTLATDEEQRRTMARTALARAAALTWERGASAALGALREVAR